jgi:uncharacterized protein with GYD domain
MNRYIVMLNWTDEGIKTIEDSPHRHEAAKGLAQIYKCELVEFYLTMGSVDIVAIIDAPSDEALMKFNLALRANGNLSTQTLKTFDRESYRNILASI